jgi:phage-related baseplate assembly protein
MSKFDAIDLSLLPAPAVIEPLDYETVLASMKADLQLRDPEFSAAHLESDPAIKVLEVAAYRETLIRQRVNDAAKATMLAHATGSDLENLAALLKVGRQIIDAGDPDAIPPVPPTYETDTRLRERAQLAMEAITNAGSEGAYIFHAKTASPMVLDVDVASPEPGEVLVTILSTEDDGIADSELLALVSAALDEKEVRPLTDQVTVQAATAVGYAIEAELDVYPGPDAEVVRQASRCSVELFAEAQRKLGEPVTIDGLHKALRVDGVRKVSMTSPAADVEPTNAQFANLTGTTVTLAEA